MPDPDVHPWLRVNITRDNQDFIEQRRQLRNYRATDTVGHALALLQVYEYHTARGSHFELVGRNGERRRFDVTF